MQILTLNCSIGGQWANGRQSIFVKCSRWINPCHWWISQRTQCSSRCIPLGLSTTHHLWYFAIIGEYNVNSNALMTDMFCTSCLFKALYSYCDHNTPTLCSCMACILYDFRKPRVENLNQIIPCLLASEILFQLTIVICKGRKSISVFGMCRNIALTACLDWSPQTAD